MNLKQLLHTAFLKESSIKAGSAILRDATIDAGKNTILPITVATSSNLPYAIAEKLARDYQVYVLQMAVQSITGVIINEMEECGVPAGAVVLTEGEDDSRTWKNSVNRGKAKEKIKEYNKEKSSSVVGTGAPKNIFTLKPSWTRIEIPVANVETNKTTTKTGKYDDNKKSTGKSYDGAELVKNKISSTTPIKSADDSKTATQSNSEETTIEQGTRLGGKIDSMQITLATQAIGFQFSGKHLAYSFLSDLNKNVSEEFEKVYGNADILRHIKKFTNIVINKITDTAFSIASGIENLYLSVASTFSKSAKQKRFNKRDSAQKIKEALQYTNIDWTTIMLNSEDLQGLELTSSVVSNFSKKNKTNILVYDETKRQVTMYVQSITIDKSNKNQTQFAMTKDFDSADKVAFSAPVIVTYPDSQLGTFRYLNSVEVY